MDYIEYFRRQAKNLHKDIKAFNEGKEPKFFNDVNRIIDWLNNVDKDLFEPSKISLQKAQHIIAIFSCFEKWADLINASETRLELAKLLLDNREYTNSNFSHYPLAYSWYAYLRNNDIIQYYNTISDKNLLSIFKIAAYEEDKKKADRELLDIMYSVMLDPSYQAWEEAFEEFEAELGIN